MILKNIYPRKSEISSNLFYPFRGFHSHGGTPIAGWFIRENPMKIRMMNGGTPILGNPHLSMIVFRITLHFMIPQKKKNWILASTSTPLPPAALAVTPFPGQT